MAKASSQFTDITINKSNTINRESKGILKKLIKCVLFEIEFIMYVQT